MSADDEKANETDVVAAPLREEALPADGKLTAYQKKLFVFLSVATFFEGYDFMALTQILPNLRADMGLNESAAGYLVGTINVGTVIAYLVVRRADQWGRRRMLTITIAGYTIFTGLSGLSPNVWVFGALQLIARIFLLGEWAISMVIAAEEFPAKRRGMVIGVIQAFSSLGSVACAGLVPLLLKLPWGWRTVYYIGVIPLVILAFARRSLRETTRFQQQVAKRTGEQSTGLLHIWSTPYVKRVLQLGLIWFVTYICTQNAVTFWKEFALAERGLSDGQVGLSITIAAVVSMPLVFLSGKLLDVLGRRGGSVIIFGLTSAGVFLSYTLHGQWPLTGALVFAIFGVSGVLPVLNAYTAELFPTHLRGDAFAWSNNMLGRIGYVLSPVGVGIVAETAGWGPAVRATAIAPIVALVLIFAMLPETKGKELEETAKV